MSIQSSFPRRRGTTLIQVMVATAVVATIMGLLLPAVQSARKSVVRTHCAHNLHNTGLAFHHWKDANVGKPFQTESWASELCPYVDSTKAAFHCPLDPFSFDLESPKISLQFYWRNRTTPLMFYDSNSNVIEVSKTSPRCRPSSAYPVLPTSPPGSWVAEFEITSNSGATGNLADWNDFYVLVEPQANASVKLTFYRGSSDAGLYPSGIVDVLDQNQNLVASSLTPGQSAYVPANGRGISYGINSRAHDLDVDLSSKILFVEYASSIARVVPPSPYNNAIERYPINIRSPHNDTLNVLFADGHIEVRTPADIDPSKAANANTWVP